MDKESYLKQSLCQQSVNSLLLSVRNLENFNKSSNAPRHLYTQETLGSNYEQKKQMLENIRTILAIDDINLTNANDKTKDTDELSTASSMTTTNFTGNIKVLHKSTEYLLMNQFQLWHSTTLIGVLPSLERSAEEAIESRSS